MELLSLFMWLMELLPLFLFGVEGAVAANTVANKTVEPAGFGGRGVW